ncbi:MAG: hypothetical protein C4524_08225 [Candidatus Zixiibacteriota bacterium]|nr:MAG: hypothetical protein C4524_08225 [candidate division Zixibacteria bacterium]
MNDTILILGAYLVALLGGHVLVRLLLKRFRPPLPPGIKGAGTCIGLLERALVLTFVLIGQHTAIGLVLTAKSIARFEELKDRNFTEYYLIGTLASMLAAILVGLAVREWRLTNVIGQFE